MWDVFADPELFPAVSGAHHAWRAETSGAASRSVPPAGRRLTPQPPSPGNQPLIIHCRWAGHELPSAGPPAGLRTLPACRGRVSAGRHQLPAAARSRVRWLCADCWAVCVRWLLGWLLVALGLHVACWSAGGKCMCVTPLTVSI